MPTRHTPEPWEADGLTILSKDGRIADVYTHGTTGATYAESLLQAKANTILMTASPGLLAALEAWVAHFWEQWTSSREELLAFRPNHPVFAAEMAITKAKGDVEYPRLHGEDDRP